MSREIIIDEDTKVGYSFQEKVFYVENKGSRTERDNVANTYKVLLIVAPTTEVQEQDLQDLKDNLEEVTSLSYTLEDTGAYVKTIALNDYFSHPLTIDCSLKKLYIMNTDIVFDLTLNIDHSFIINDLISYYTKTLGLNIPTSLMTSIYDFLYSYYTPTIYNHVTRDEDTNTLYYSSLISLSNFNNASPISYTLERNPKALTTPTVLGNIETLDQSNNTIILTQIPSATFPETHTELSLTTSGITSGGISVDETYTYTNRENNIVYVKENLPIEYSFKYPKVYLQSPITSITSISNPTSSVTVSSVTDFNVGDIVTIYNASNIGNNGEYEIVGIEGNIITFSTVPPVSLTANCGDLMKLTYIGDVVSISTNTITTKSPISLSTPSTIMVTTGEGKTLEEWNIEVSSVSGSTITVSSTLTNYTPSYPTLIYNKQATLININMLSSTLGTLPVGEFNVDDNEQCQEYINLGKDSYTTQEDKEAFEEMCTPPSEALENVWQVYTPIDTIADKPATFKGLYKEIYS